MSKKKIKMSEFLLNGSNIFSGRDKGIEARKAIGLDEIEQECDQIIFLIPKETWGINPSFFGGLLEGSYKKERDVDKFWAKYCFRYTDESELDDSLKADIEEDLRYILNSLEE